MENVGLMFSLLSSIIKEMENSPSIKNNNFSTKVKQTFTSAICYVNTD